jgi:hypothetical protein
LFIVYLTFAVKTTGIRTPKSSKKQLQYEMEYTVHDLSWIRISASGKPFLLRALARNMLI